MRLTLLITLVSFMLCGCSVNNVVKSITPQEVKEKMGDNADIILLDVRTQEEYDQGHIPGSILLPLDKLESQIENVIPNKNAEIIIYCRSGNRSAKAADLLEQLGYKDISDLGGIIDWPYDIIL
ncbi:MAG: rhodanese-like domain-containing protein [Eubacteriaceae bacterium]